MKSKIPAPNYTQIPNALLDLIPLMSESEMKVAFAIARETFGWHRKSKKLSLTALEKLTGLTRKSVVAGIDAGIERGIITRIPDAGSFRYSLQINDLTSGKFTPVEESASGKFTPELVENLHQPSGKFTPELVENLHQQAPSTLVESKNCGDLNKQLNKQLNKTTSSPKTATGQRPVSTTTQALDEYQSLFKAKFGLEPCIKWKKDSKLIKDIVAQYGLELTKECLRRFLNLKDPFVVDGGYTIGIFSTRFNGLLIGDKQTVRPRMVV